MIAEWYGNVRERSRWQTAGDELGYDFPERYVDEKGEKVRRHEYIGSTILEACDWCDSVIEWTSAEDDNTCLFETRVEISHTVAHGDVCRCGGEVWETFFMCWLCHQEASDNCECQECEWVEAFGTDDNGDRWLMVSQEEKE